MPRSSSDPLSPTTQAAIAVSLFGGAAMLMGIWASVHSAEGTETPLTDALVTMAEVAAPEIEPGELWSADFTAPLRRIETVSGELKSRDTLIDLVTRLGAAPAEAYAALSPVYEADYLDPRRLRPGVSATLTLEHSGEAETPRLVGLSLRESPDHSILVTRTDDETFEAAKLSARLTPAFSRISGEIETSLYEAALDLGARDQQVVDFAKVFAYDVDFQREIHPGDRFEIVYETMVDERGRPVRMGEVLFAALDSRTLEKAFYRHTPSDDEVTDYFDFNGESATKFLMKTPINGARLSSGFGKRRHPISGYSRMHKGTDFAAPTGTPIYAAGHGVVERASRWGGYGHYIRIRHANGYKTAYAHLSRYARGIRSGKRVRQGQVIGYVGSTGASTGPHLHYEVLIRGMHVNPMTLDLPTGRKLSGDVLDEFIEARNAIDAVRRNKGAEIEMAAKADVPT